MSISKCWIDLYRSGIALQCTLDILHLLQCVSHVGISISKCWTDSEKQMDSLEMICTQTKMFLLTSLYKLALPNGFLVMH